MEDFLDPINSVGMPEKVDSAIALDLLITIKEVIRNYSAAITEAASPEARVTIRNQMDAAIDFQTEIIELLMKKKWFYPYSVQKQQALDLDSAKNALDIANLKLFSENNNRKGLFPTPQIREEYIDESSNISRSKRSCCERSGSADDSKARRYNC